MALVALIDDRTDVRERLANKIRRILSNDNINWEVNHFNPLENLDDYPKWIVNEKVVILIVDERLKEEKIGGKYNSYNGHDIVEIIRKTNKELPIYVITAHNDDKDLEIMKGEFEDVISRDKFSTTESAKQYVKRFVRATQTYLKNFESEYIQLAKLSELVALDKATESDFNKLKALQEKLNLPLSQFNVNKRKDWLEDLDNKNQELEELAKQIEKLLTK